MTQVFEDNAIDICMPLSIMTLHAQTIGGKQNEDAGVAKGAGRAGAEELNGKTKIEWLHSFVVSHKINDCQAPRLLQWSRACGAGGSSDWIIAF